MRLLRSIDPLVAAIAAIVVLVALAIVLWPSSGTRTLYADFSRTVSVYQGSDVRILGVPVGKVDSVTPMGTVVRVKMEYSDKYKLPKDVNAVIISPSIVGDRFVQLTSKTGFGTPLAASQVLPSGWSLGTTRTAVPLELDEIYGSLNQLSTALGPNGANAPGTTGEGALTRLLDSTARNFGGQGVNFNNTIQNLGKLSQTLNDNKDVLFGTQAAVEKFVNALAVNDTTVRQFTQSLAEGASMLSSDRQDLASALDNLATALDQVRSFVADNKALLTSNIAGLTRVSETLVKRRNELAEILKTAPLALNNLSLAYNGKTGTVNTRSNTGQSLTQLSASPGAMLCAFIQAGAGKNVPCPLAGLPRAAYDQVKQAQQTNRHAADPTLGGLVAP